MEHIKTIIIPNPPTKWVISSKKKIDPKTGRLKQTTYYLTANLFYTTNAHYHVRNEIVNYCKEVLMCYFGKLPKLNKARITVTYSRPSDNFDIDNKAGFWLKIGLDLIKTPTKTQLLKGGVKSVYCIPDDSAKFIDEITMKYEKGKHFLKFDIYGILADDQNISI